MYFEKVMQKVHSIIKGYVNKITSDLLEQIDEIGKMIYIRAHQDLSLVTQASVTATVKT